MTSSFSLRSLEGLLEAFIERFVHSKHRRLGVIGGINRLDDIARADGSDDLTEQVGDWFAEHNRWLSEEVLKPADAVKIGELLGEISKHLEIGENTPAVRKVTGEINRWQEKSGQSTQKLVLKRKPENPPEEEIDTITQFGQSLDRVAAIFADASGGKKHLLSALDDSLKSAVVSRSKEALLLSAYLIYYLKLNGYIVDPFVKRLKEAERWHKKGTAHA